MRAFLYFTAFAAACGQFLLCSDRLKGLWKPVPTLLSLTLTLAIYYITEHSVVGGGTFPFPGGFGLYAFFIMCTTGAAVGLVALLLWRLLFHKADLPKDKLTLTRIGFIFAFFFLTFIIYHLTD